MNNEQNNWSQGPQGLNGMNGNGMPNNMQTPNGMNGMSSPMRPPKQPMNPAKKKKIILGISLGLGAVVLATVGIIVAMMLLRADYGESYRAAKAIREEVYKIYQSNDCANVVNYAKKSSTTVERYNEYISGCLALDDSVIDEAAKLGETSGVKRNAEIQAQYEKFKALLDSSMPDTAVLEEKLALYRAWHEFAVITANLSASKSTDAELESAVKPLIESGNATLKEYGEGWLEKTSAYVQAVRTYNNTSYSSSSKSQLYDEASQKKAEQSNWVKENAPDILQLAELKFDDRKLMYEEFKRLYSMIAEEYASNYDNSGDCTEFFGEVYCD